MKKSIVSPGFVKRTLAKLLKLDQQLGIVVDGNVASQAIAVGKYVNLINSTITGKPDGIYVATGAVSSGGTVTAADISGDAITDGVTNNLSEHLGNLIKIVRASTYTAQATANTFVYTGISVTIPKNSFFIIAGRGIWANNGFSNCKFSNSSSTYNLPNDTYSQIVGQAGTQTGGCILCGQTGNSDVTFYLWGKWDGSGMNWAFINGFYVSL